LRARHGAYLSNPIGNLAADTSRAAARSLIQIKLIAFNMPRNPVALFL